MEEGILQLLDLSGGSETDSIIHLGPDEKLIEEGETDDRVYILLNGSLNVSHIIDGEESLLAVVDDPGSVIGEIVSLGGGRRTATVRAQDETDVVSVPSTKFRQMLEQRPRLAQELAALAVRRAEEVELSELLASHFGITDDEALVSACASVDWRLLRQGDILIEEGDDSEAVYFVIRGKLLATRHDPETGEPVRVGEAARGDVVGEIGVLAAAQRMASVVAARDSVVATMKAQPFLQLVERQPRLMIDLTLKAVARADHEVKATASNTILAAMPVGDVDLDVILRSLQDELSRRGTVHVLNAEKMDGLLAAPGISASVPGEVGDVRLSRAIHEMELEADVMVLDVGRANGGWARRCLGLADRTLIFTPENPSEVEVAHANTILRNCLPTVGRTVVIEHPGSNDPSGTADLMAQFSGDTVLHIGNGAARDLARVARVAAGRANALVLGGGGGRGFAHIGVYRALEELGFPVDVVGGTSIGGVLSTLVADAMDSDEMLGWAEARFVSLLDYTIPVVSLIKGAKITRAATSVFGDRHIEDLRRTFFCLSTDLTTARPHIHRTGPVVLAIRATSALPGVMPPVPLGDSLLVDGGVLNNLPADIARDLAPKGNVLAVDVAPPRGPSAHADYGLAVSGWDALRSGRGSGRSRYPRISAVLMRSMIAASMRERDRQVRDGLPDLYLDLDMRGVGMLDFDAPAAVAAKGYDLAMPRLEDWLTSNHS